MRMYKRIVVGTDGSDTAKYAVQKAAGMASKLGAELHILSAYEPVPKAKLREEAKDVPPDMEWMINPREEVDAVLKEAAESVEGSNCEVITVEREGSAADVILDYAEEAKADLIVVGNKGMASAKRFLLGSVPNKVSHQAPCDLLIIHTT